MSLDLRSLSNRMLIGNLDIPLIMVMRPNIDNFSKSCSKQFQEVRTNSGWVDVHIGNNRDIITLSGFTYTKVGNSNMYSDSEDLTSNLISSAESVIGGNGNDSQGPKQWAEIDRAMMKLEQIYKLDKEKIGSLYEMLQSNYISTGITKVAKNIVPALIPNKLTTNPSGGRANLKDAIKNGYAKRAQSFIIFDYVMYWGYFVDFRLEKSATNNPRSTTYSMTFKVVDDSVDFLTRSLISNFPEARGLQFFTQLKDVVSYSSSIALNADKALKSLFLT